MGRLGLNLIWDIDNCQDLAKMAGSLWVMQNVEKILNGWSIIKLSKNILLFEVLNFIQNVSHWNTLAEESSCCLICIGKSFHSTEITSLIQICNCSVWNFWFKTLNLFMWSGFVSLQELCSTIRWIWMSWQGCCCWMSQVTCQHVHDWTSWLKLLFLCSHQ